MRTGSLPGAGLDCAMPTASAVGIAVADLEAIQCLASDRPGLAVENRGRRPSWRYSGATARVLPASPAARSRRSTARRLLLVGGTASIVGEESRHAGDRAAQVEEALTEAWTC